MEDSESSSDDEVVVIPYTKPKPPEILLDSDQEIEVDNEESAKELESKDDNDSDMEILITTTTTTVQKESRQKTDKKNKRKSQCSSFLSDLLLKRHSEILQSQRNERSTEAVSTNNNNNSSSSIDGTTTQKTKSTSHIEELPLSSNSGIPNKTSTTRINCHATSSQSNGGSSSNISSRNAVGNSNNKKANHGATSTSSSSLNKNIVQNLIQPSFNYNLTEAQKKKEPRLEQILISLQKQREREKLEKSKSASATKTVQNQNNDNNNNNAKKKKAPVAKKTRKTKDTLSAADIDHLNFLRSLNLTCDNLAKNLNDPKSKASSSTSSTACSNQKHVEEEVQNAAEEGHGPTTILIGSDGENDVEIPSNHMMCTNFPDCTNSNECGMACYKIELSRNEHRILCQVDQKLQIIKRIRDRSTNKTVNICLLKNLPEIHLCGKFYDEVRDRIFSLMYQLSNLEYEYYETFNQSTWNSPRVDKVVQMLIEEENNLKSQNVSIPLQKKKKRAIKTTTTTPTKRKRKLPAKRKSKSSSKPSKSPSKTRRTPKKQKNKKADTVPTPTTTSNCTSTMTSTSKDSSRPRVPSLKSTTLPGTCTSTTTTTLPSIEIDHDNVSVINHPEPTCNNNNTTTTTTDSITSNPEFPSSSTLTNCNINVKFPPPPQPFIALPNPIFYQTLHPPDASTSAATLNVNGSNNNGINTLNRNHDIDERNLPADHRVSFPVISPESPFAVHQVFACGYPPTATFLCYAGPLQLQQPYMTANNVFMQQNVMSSSTPLSPLDPTPLSNSNNNNNNNNDANKNTMGSSPSNNESRSIGHNLKQETSNNENNNDDEQRTSVNMGQQHPPDHEQQRQQQQQDKDDESDEIIIESITFKKKPILKKDNPTTAPRSSVINSKNGDVNTSNNANIKNKINNGTNKESRFIPHQASRSYYSHYSNYSNNNSASTTNSNIIHNESNSNKNNVDPDPYSKKPNRLQKTTVQKCIKDWKSPELRDLFLYLNDVSMDCGVTIGRVKKGDNLTINIESISLKDLTTAKTKILQRLGCGASKKTSSSNETATTSNRMEKDTNCDDDNIGKESTSETNLFKNSNSNDRRSNNSPTTESLSNPRHDSSSKNNDRNNHRSSPSSSSSRSNNNITSQPSSDTASNNAVTSSSEARIRSTRNTHRERANSSERESLHGRPSIHRGLHQYHPYMDNGESRSLGDKYHRGTKNYQRNDTYSHRSSSRGKEAGEHDGTRNQNYRGQFRNHYSNNNNHYNNNSSNDKSTSNADTNYNRHYDNSYDDYFNYNNRYDFEGSHYNNDNRSQGGQQKNRRYFQ